jgi:membrane protein
MPARPTSSRLPALGAILGLALVRLVTRRGGTPAHHVPDRAEAHLPARAEPHAEEPERKPSNSAPSSHEASREPGRGREARSPTEIPAKGWKDILWRVYEEVNKDRILAVAAGVTFYGLLALFPALAALVSIYGLFADPATIQDHLNLLSGVLPGGALEVISEQVKRITSKGSGTLGFAFFSGLAISLWSANAGVKAVFDALNVAYDEEEKRGFIALNLRSLAFTLGMILFVLVAVGAIVVIPVLLDFIGLGQVTEWIISLARWPVLLGAIVLVLAVLYRYGPSRDTAQWRWISAGSLVAAVVWVAASMLFSWYVANFGNYNETYGSLGAVIGFMTWMWLSTTVVLVGAELNAEIEHQTVQDTTEGPERPLGARGARMADSVGAAKA